MRGHVGDGVRVTVGQGVWVTLCELWCVGDDAGDAVWVRMR